jgi:hypothetical protein
MNIFTLIKHTREALIIVMGIVILISVGCEILINRHHALVKFPPSPSYGMNEVQEQSVSCIGPSCAGNNLTKKKCHYHCFTSDGKLKSAHVPSLSSLPMTDASTQLKGHVVGLLDSLQKECAQDELLADAVIQVVSSRTFSNNAAFITHIKSALADFMIGEMASVDKGKQELEAAIANAEAYLHVLSKVSARLSPTWKTGIADWAKPTKDTLMHIYSDDFSQWKIHKAFPVVASHYIAPLILSDGELSQEIWTNAKKRKREAEEHIAKEQATKKARVDETFLL